MANVPPASFEEWTRSFGFTAHSEAVVRSIAVHARPLIPAVVSRFYHELLEHEPSAAILRRGPWQLDDLRRTLETWLTEVFEGPYDETYHQKRRRIGRAHVRVGLPQHFMFVGMALVWRELEQRLRACAPPDLDEKLGALHTLLMLDLGIMLESYKEGYAEEVRDYERSAVEEKLTRAEHLAEIGQLAASLAHEIKNPLAGISGAIQVIRDGMPEDDARRPIVREILGQIRRLDATVKDLLRYARPTAPKVRPVAVDEVVRRVLTVLQEEPALQGRRVKYEPAGEDVTLVADEAQIEQLLMNLLINAAHASKDGAIIRVNTVRSGPSLRLVVRDEGCGMTREALGRAFEPFFTTKARGTGLGLSICRRIAEVHGGTIKLESEVDHGTTVIVTLPVGKDAHTGKVAS